MGREKDGGGEPGADADRRAAVTSFPEEKGYLSL